MVQAQSLRWRHAMSLMRRASSALLEADMITLTLMTGGTGWGGPFGWPERIKGFDGFSWCLYVDNWKNRGLKR